MPVTATRTGKQPHSLLWSGAWLRIFFKPKIIGICSLNRLPNRLERVLKQKVRTMRLAIAGGKGGTGKTMIAASLVEYLGNNEVALFDVDVEEPDAHFFLGHEILDKKNHFRLVPRIDANKCNYCGLCARICAFNALAVLPGEVLLFPELCHSCSACLHLCPSRAISEEEHHTGEIEEALLFGGGKMVSGFLDVGEPRATTLINAVKQYAQGINWNIIDCPPGSSCPVIEAIRYCDYCLLVTEPTPFGLHDLELVLEACRMLDIPAGIVINRWQGSDGNIDHAAARNGVPVLTRIPFMPELARAYSRGKNPLHAAPCLYKSMEEIIRGVKEALA